MTEQQISFLNLRKKTIERDFSRMNDMQMKAVTATEGPLLILAGAGSGKTTVLVNRISNLVKYGDAYISDFVPNVSDEMLMTAEEIFENPSANAGIFAHNPAKPWEILAITFTNKAANELKERIENMLGESARYIKAGTFHSICSKILRRDGERLGYTSHYTIYDTDDQKKVMKEVFKKLDISDKQLHPKTVLGEISRAKDRLITPGEYLTDAANDPRMKLIGKAYAEYQKQLIASDAMDFDDLISNTVRLFQENDDILDNYQSHIKYIMVDEYQDTNYAQYMLIKLLGEKYGNVCVVGDDDQSIYRFRGATIENILNFEKQYPNAKVIRLEQNYRSTQNILDAANAVIANNCSRKGKNLWTDNGQGEKIKVVTADDESGEARFVGEKILEHIRNGGKFSDCAVLYRMNAQTNALENVFVRSGIPYKVIGGMKFYERMEIKDVIAYLNVINNPNDNVRLRRIINSPKRGIGDTTVSYASDISDMLGISLFEVFENAENYPSVSRASAKLKAFCSMIRELQSVADEIPLYDLFDKMLDMSGYKAYLQTLPPDEREREENVNELSTSIRQYVDENENPSLSGFLEEVSLISDIDSYSADSDSTVLMTLHSAKGLEFNTVFIVGMEEGIFPGNQTIYGGPEEMEEERRLAYVGITRAKEKLYILSAYRRMLYGQTNYNHVSRFVEEIPKFLCENINRSKSSGFGTSSFGGYGGYSSGFNRAGIKPPVKTEVRNKPVGTDKYSVGIRVKHTAFGEGVIVKATPMGNDVLLEINFSSVGLKKVMAAYAKLEKL